MTKITFTSTGIPLQFTYDLNHAKHDQKTHGKGRARGKSKKPKKKKGVTYSKTSSASMATSFGYKGLAESVAEEYGGRAMGFAGGIYKVKTKDGWLRKSKAGKSRLDK